MYHPRPFRLVHDGTFDKLTSRSIVIPELSLSLYPAVQQPAGTLVFDTDTDSLYISNGKSWISVSAGGSNISYGSISSPGSAGAGALTVNVMGASGVTTANATTIAGNLYLYPGASAAITGPFSVTGVTIAGDSASSPTALAAQSDLTSAYTQAANLTGGVTVSGDIGGETLTPGVYTSASSLSITGILTLNGLGNPDSTFVFQIGSTLTTASGSSIVLINGAQAKNVSFQIGSSATFGTTSSVQGIFMAQASITFNGGNTLVGRALARTGAVTFAGAASTVELP